MNKITVVIVDDMEEIRQYLSSILEKEEDIEVVGMASSGYEAIPLVRSQRPDVVLMDIQMETNTAGIDAAEQIHAEFPQIKIIVITIHEEDGLLFRAYAAGAMDYIIKSDSPETIIRSTKSVYENQLLLRPVVAEKIREEFNHMITYKDSLIFVLNLLTKLTNSELDVLKAAYEGYSYREIAAMRYVSLATIKTHVNSILKKFQMKRMKDIQEILRKINFAELMRQF